MITNLYEKQLLLLILSLLLLLYFHLEATGDGILKEVICENIPKFPDMEIIFKDGTLKLESKYYIRRAGNKCYSTLVGKDMVGKMWIFGDPLL